MDSRKEPMAPSDNEPQRDAQDDAVERCVGDALEDRLQDAPIERLKRRLKKLTDNKSGSGN